MAATALSLAPSRRPMGVYLAVLAVLALALLSVAVLDWDLRALWDGQERAGALQRVGSFLAAFAALDLGAEALAQGFELSLQTLSTALLGTALGLTIGYVLALCASRAVLLGTGSVRSQPLRRVLLEGARLLLDVLRGVPDFAWAILILTIPGPGPVTGVLAIGLSVGGILGKIFSELWDGVDTRRYEAVAATGAGRLATFFFGIQPLAARSMLSYTLMRTECAIRNASVIGVVGGGGLGAQLFDEFNFGNHARVVTLLLFVLALTASADLISNFLRYQLRNDPSHPRAGRGTDLVTARRRRRAAFTTVGLLLCGSVVWLWPAFIRAASELGRIEWAWIRSELGQLLVPDLGWATVSEALASTRVPLALGLLGTLVGVGIAAAAAFPGSVAFQVHAARFTGERLSAVPRALRGLVLVVTRVMALCLRSVPEVAWLLIFAAFFRIGTAAAVLAIAFHTGGVLARVFIEAIDDVPYRSLEQVSLGSRASTFLYAGVPAAARSWFTYSAFQFESNVRGGIVLGIIGVGGLGDLFHTSFVHWSLHRASTFLLVMVLLTALLDRTSRGLKASSVARA